MSTLSTQINPRSDVFQANEAAMLGEVNKLRELTAAIAQGGGEKARARHIKKIEELKNLSFKPKSWTTEESLEEMIEGLEEAVKKTDQEIRQYKEKIKEFSFQD